MNSGLLHQMTEFQRFRGPDGKGIWCSGSVGLSHTLLFSTPESRGERQPFTLDGEVWITADARVDARANLLGELFGAGRARLGAPTDAELILRAYGAWGKNCVEHLLGDFSFAIWDNRRQELFCAVDHFGVKPFFYAHVGQLFVFGNSLECVRMHPHVPNRLDERAIGDFLLFGLYQDRDITAYADIRRIPPAHSLVVSRAGLVRHCYWSLAGRAELRFPRRRDYLEKCQDLLNHAVSDRLRTPAVAVSMSGGIDSPLVAATARNYGGADGSDCNLHAFTVVFEKLIPDEERRYATAVAKALEIPIHFQECDSFVPYAETGWAPPEPVHNPAWVADMALLRQAATFARVLLTGFDGDALLGSDLKQHLHERLKSQRWLRLAREGAWYVFTQWALPPIGLRSTARRWFRCNAPVVSQPAIPVWLDPDFVARNGLVARWRAVIERPKTAGARGPAHDMMSTPTWLRILDDYDPGVNGLVLEVRHPLMDVRLVEFATSLPTIPWCVHKEILRACLRRHAPRSVYKRPKTPLADDPLCVLVRSGWSHQLNRLEIAPELSLFVRPETIPTIDRDKDVDFVWSNLRPLSLDRWLKARPRTVFQEGARANGISETAPAQASL